MKRRGYLVAGLALAVGAALVSGGAGAAAHRTAIVGGSPSQRPLLRTILAELAPTHLARVRLVRVPRGVELSAPVTGVRATWELLVAGAALHYRSAARHLPRVVAVGAGRASWPASNAGRRPPRATRPRVAAALRHMRRLARSSGARIRELRVFRPDAVAVVLRLRVRGAAHFLRHRLRAVIVGAQALASRSDGLLVEVDDARGIAWTSAETPLGGLGFVRPRLAGCDPFPPPGPPMRVFPSCPA